MKKAQAHPGEARAPCNAGAARNDQAQETRQ
jgi:hypothetical protein